MSIWCSREHIGTDPLDGKWQDFDGKPLPPEGAHRGNVVSFAEGFSNHYPDMTGTHERPAVLALATIAPWCTPGHDESGDCCGVARHDHPDVGGWLRLEVAAPEALNFWTKTDDGEPTVEQQSATVCLDRAAAKALRDDLNDWLALNHLAPTNAESGETHE